MQVILLPYFWGLFEQLLFWRALGASESVAWPLVPIPFTGWRFVQLARAASLAATVEAPWVLTTTISYILIPFWVINLCIHLLLWPALFKWKRKESAFVFPIGPGSREKMEKNKAKDTDILEEISLLTVQRDRLRVRCEALKKMQTGGTEEPETPGIRRPIDLD
mmetsp:Transcript_14631/g.22727  ORF Transcript_14631/g.22727 Transcript_14631/m.22727 type:complete len:164 (+) Transcript_14631:538-1029(+)